jgi:hypothetical protein
MPRPVTRWHGLLVLVLSPAVAAITFAICLVAGIAAIINPLWGQE